MKRETPQGKQILGVTFDLSDPIERELWYFIGKKTANFSNLVKHLIFAWRYGWLEGQAGVRNSSASPSKRVYEIKNSGIPFS